MKETRKPFQVGLTMEGGEAVLNLQGIIGWSDDALTFGARIDEAVNSGASSLTLKVNSMGGYCTDALGMYDKIKALSIPTRAEVHGTAESAATLVCIACDTVAMSRNAKWMVHQPSAGVWGTVDEIMATAQSLIKDRDRMFALYGEKCGKEGSQVDAEHKTSVYYTSEEAKAYGFVDEIIGEDSEAPAADEPPTTNEDAPVNPDEPQARRYGSASEMRAACRDRHMPPLRLSAQRTAPGEEEDDETEAAEKPEKPKPQKGSDETEKDEQTNTGDRDSKDDDKNASTQGGAQAVMTAEQLNAAINQKVAEQLAALGVEPGSLPSPGEESGLRATGPSTNLSAMSLEDRLAMIQTNPQAVLDYLRA